MLTVLTIGGFRQGHNLGAKVRRERFEPVHLFHPHGASIEADKGNFASLEKYAMSRPDPIQHASAPSGALREHRKRVHLIVRKEG
jgi:hypothetical protein